MSMILNFNEKNLLRALERNGSCLGAWPFDDEYRPAKKLIELGLAYLVNGTLEVIAITPLGRKMAARLEKADTIEAVLDRLPADDTDNFGHCDFCGAHAPLDDDLCADCRNG